MPITIVEGTPTRETFDRCFNEAWEKISIERQRVGDSELREALWSTLSSFEAISYVLDGHTLGVASYSSIERGDESWMWYRYPTFGCDANGSRSWFYSEDFQRASYEFWSTKGHVGFVVVANTASPASAAVRSIWGTYSGFYTAPVERTPAEVFEAPIAQAMPAGTVVFESRLTPPTS